MRKKGFTLIELLAIIVILAIIALIAVPMITGIIEKSRKSSVELSAKAYISAVEDYVVLSKADVPIADGSYGIEELTEFGVSVKGMAPSDGTVQIQNGKVISYLLVMGKYVVENGKATISTYTNIGNIYKDIIASGVETYNYMDGTYFKGNIKNNYVWYNGFIWRIMGKNADGSIRLITEEDVTTIPWGASKTAQDYGNSYIKDWVNNYFLPRLKDTSKIVSTSFCEDSTTVSSSSSRTTCSNPVLAQAGILSLDEYNLAGGSSSYLVNDQDYLTLTPYSMSIVCYVGNNGIAYCTYNNVTSAYGARAVISLSFDTIITTGNGTLTGNADTEYVAGQTLDDVTGTLSPKSGSGEYVKFDGRLYRIVEHTGEGTKLILDGFYDTTQAYGTDFADMSTLLTSSDFLNWLSPTRQADILDTTWYRGDYWGSSSTTYDYKTNLSSTANPFTNKAGLIRIGEMLASQSLSIISSNYSKTNSLFNTKNYWTLTPYSALYTWRVYSYSHAYLNDVTDANSVRPVITISSSMTITSGNGTLSSPYQV